MKIAVLGGDGFVGWPTVLHLSDLRHEVHIIDNLSRRWIDTELGVQSLTPMGSIQERCRIWKEVTGKTLNFHLLDLAKEYERLKSWLVENKLDGKDTAKKMEVMRGFGIPYTDEDIAGAAKAEAIEQEADRRTRRSEARIATLRQEMVEERRAAAVATETADRELQELRLQCREACAERDSEKITSTRLRRRARSSCRSAGGSGCRPCDSRWPPPRSR